MGFMKPKVPKTPPPPNPAITANEAEAPGASIMPDNIASFISTSARGLKRRATTQRTSLIGGA